MTRFDPHKLFARRQRPAVDAAGQPIDPASVYAAVTSFVAVDSAVVGYADRLPGSHPRVLANASLWVNATTVGRLELNRLRNRHRADAVLRGLAIARAEQ